MLKTIHPRYYLELGRKELWISFKFFLKVLFLSFIVMGILAIPTFVFMQSDMKKSTLDVAQFKVTTTFETLERIELPENNPIASFDTSGNESFEKGWFLVTKEKFYFKLFDEKKSINIYDFDFTQNREVSLDIINGFLIFLLPGLFAWYYFIYGLKYLLIIIPFAVISFIFAKMSKSRISVQQAIVLALYTATPLIFIEIIMIPFSFNKFLITFSPIMGVNFSLIPLTLFFILFVTAIRINRTNEL